VHSHSGEESTFQTLKPTYSAPRKTASTLGPARPSDPPSMLAIMALASQASPVSSPSPHDLCALPPYSYSPQFTPHPIRRSTDLASCSESHRLQGFFLGQGPAWATMDDSLKAHLFLAPLPLLSCCLVPSQWPLSLPGNYFSGACLGEATPI
jgi:hypothetical protein